MKTAEILERLLPYAGQSEHAERIVSQIRFAAYMSEAENGKFDGTIESAAGPLFASLEKEGAITISAAKESEELLSALSSDAKRCHVHLVAHAHIDMNWMWGYEETASVTVATFRTMLDLMERYPAFTFSQSQASTYEIVEKYAPEMLNEIKARVREGRWELSSATWVENDENMPSAESLARHLLYTRRYYKKLFGEDAPLPELDFQPDTFGHSLSIPEICNKGGVRWFYHCRGNDGATSAYVWRAKSGAELLSFCDPHWYAADICPELFDRVPSACKKYCTPCWLYVYGVGDHGGGPSARDIEKILEMQTWPVMPTLLFSSYRAFFTELETCRDSLPVLTEECNFVFAGCYTSQSEIKAQNRLGEDRLYEAELLSAAATTLAGAPGKSGIFERAWRRLLFNQFHDILPGSGVPATRAYALGTYQECLAAAGCAANEATTALAEAISLENALSLPDKEGETDAPGGGGYFLCGARRYALSQSAGLGGGKRAFHIFNTLQEDFEGVYELTVWDWPYDGGSARFTNEQGDEIPFVYSGGSRGYWGHEYKTFLLDVKLPGCGYGTVFLEEAVSPSLPPLPAFGNRTEAAPPREILLENKKIKAVFDYKNGELLSLFDKESGKETVKPGSGVFRLSLENAAIGMTAWKQGPCVKSEILNENCTVVVRGAYKNALRCGFSYDFSFGNGSSLNVNVYLNEHENALRYETSVDFREIGDGRYTPRLEVCFGAGSKVSSLLCGAQTGVIERKPVDHDLPAFFIGAVTEQDAPALFLTSDGKYGFGCTEKEASLTLLRASHDPDPLPEYGRHTIRFAVGAVKPCGLEKENARVMHAPLSFPARAHKGGTLPPRAQFLSADGARLRAVKLSEDGKGLICRLTGEGDKRICVLRFFKAPAAAYLVDLHETRISPLPIEDGAVRCEIAPAELQSVLVEF